MFPFFALNALRRPERIFPCETRNRTLNFERDFWPIGRLSKSANQSPPVRVSSAMPVDECRRSNDPDNVLPIAPTDPLREAEHPNKNAARPFRDFQAFLFTAQRVPAHLELNA